MSSIISGLAGAGGAANTAGGYYQNAMNNVVNAYGSPAAQTFGAEQNAALQPLFTQQDQSLLARENAVGLGGSGAAKADLGNLAASQSATLAGAIAPLYQQALSQYGSINEAMPGAQVNAYQNAINNFYAGLSDAGSLIAGLPPSAQTGGGGGPVYTNNPATSSTDATYSSNPYAPVGG